MPARFRTRHTTTDRPPLTLHVEAVDATDAMTAADLAACLLHGWTADDLRRGTLHVRPEVTG